MDKKRKGFLKKQNKMLEYFKNSSFKELLAEGLIKEVKHDNTNRTNICTVQCPKTFK